MKPLLLLLLAALGTPALAAEPVAESPSAQVDEDREFGFFRAYKRAHARGDIAAMAQALADFKGQPIVSKLATQNMRTAELDLANVGSELADDAFDGLTWMQGEAQVRGIQLVVFAEQWCPHCRREVPRLPAFAAQHDADLVLVTRMSRGVTADTMMGWVREAGVTGPVGHDSTRALSTNLAVGPVPHSVVLVNGRVVWRGHPSLLTRPDTALAETVLRKKADKAVRAAASSVEAALVLPWPPVDGGDTLERPAEHAEATALVKEATRAAREARWGDVAEALDRLQAEYPESLANRAANRIRGELAAIGRTVPAAPFTPLQGTVTWPPVAPTLVVFWEAWCPHCKREMPTLNALAERYAGRAEFIGFTRLTRSATRQSATAFLEDGAITVPMGIEGGDISATFGVRGIPAAALVRDGRIVWRGHPAALDDTLMETLLTEDVGTLLEGVDE